MVDLVSVVICTYDMDRYPSFSEATENVRVQTREPIEIVLGIDGNEKVYERMTVDYGDNEIVSIYNNVNRVSDIDARAGPTLTLKLERFGSDLLSQIDI